MKTGHVCINNKDPPGTPSRQDLSESSQSRQRSARGPSSNCNPWQFRTQATSACHSQLKNAMNSIMILASLSRHMI